MEGTPHPVVWRPSTAISQKVLDQVFSESLAPSAKSEVSSEGNPTKTSPVKGFPAGYESEIDSNLDEIDLETHLG